MHNIKQTRVIALIFILILQSILLAQRIEDKEYSKEKIGNFEFCIIQDAKFEMNSQLLYNPDTNVVKQMIPTGKMPNSVNAFIIKTGKNTVLIDAGLGTQPNGSKGGLLANMKDAGIEPEKIDYILITHGHYDHVGGLLTSDGKAVFPNAKLYFPLKDAEKGLNENYSSLNENEKKQNALINQIVNAYANRIKYLDADCKILEGISAKRIPGHTPGHTGYLIESKGKKLFIYGDLMHYAPYQVFHPETSFVYDNDKEMAATTRKNILAWAAKNNIPLTGVHIPLPGIFRVKAKGKSFEIVK